jgi:hypothetical protein
VSKGILIFKGMKVGFLPGDLSFKFTENGKFNPKAVLSTAYNVVPIWVKSAHDSLRQANLASQEISQNWSEEPEKRRQLLLAELTPSMQVFVSCGIAIDGFYDMLRPYSKISEAERDAWRKNKTSRAKQVVETFRRTHKLKLEVLKSFDGCVSRIFKLRDMAVHPSLELKNSCTHPEINIGVDWKFAEYRFSNAEWCLTNTVNLFVYLYEHKSEVHEVNEAISAVIDALEELKVVQRIS